MSYRQRVWTKRSLEQCEDCGYVVQDLADHECPPPESR